MRRYSIEQDNMLKGMDFYYLRENINKIIGYTTRCCKTASKKVAHKAGEFIANKIANAISKPKR